MLVISFTFSGCAGEETAGYRKFIVKEDLVSFSFEYPSSYQKPYLDRTIGPEHISLLTGHWTNKNDIDIVDSSLHFMVGRSSSVLTDAKAVFEFISDINMRSQDYKVLERSSITITGIQCEQIIYSYTQSPDVYHKVGRQNPIPKIAYEVYFDSEGIIWSICMSADMSRAEQTEIEFRHVLNTFKILE